VSHCIAETVVAMSASRPQGDAFEIGSFLEDQPVIAPNKDAKVIERPADKRSHMVDRQHAPQQVVCYICCSEFGTSSLPIHQKTCLKKHAWAIEANIVNAEGVSKKTAQKNKKLCSEPGSGPTLPIPTNQAPLEAFKEYNDEAVSIFFDHAKHCLLCRTRDEEYEKLKKAEEEARRRAAEEEARRRAEEEARRQAEEEARRRAEEEARRKAEEDARRKAEEEARRQAEEEARRKAEEEARRKAEEDARQRAEEEAARKKAEEDARQRAAEEEEKARRRAEEEAKRKAEEEAERQRKQREARQKAAADARKRMAQAEWERIQRDLARKRAAEEDALIQAQLEEARRLAAEREEEERRRRQMAMGKRNFLRKGEGHIAALETGKVVQEREADERAKRDIAEYSLLHAKKGGLVKPSSSSSHSRPVLGSGGGSDSRNTSQDGVSSGGKKSRPVSGAKGNSGAGVDPGEIKNGVVYKEMDAKYDSNWNEAWTEEDELNFLKARGAS
jgi:hypothetical protein